MLVFLRDTTYCYLVVNGGDLLNGWESRRVAFSMEDKAGSTGYRDSERESLLGGRHSFR